MFGSLERNLETFRIEAFSPDYLVRAQLKPLGDLPNYLNDRRREFIPLDEVEIVPLVGDRHLRPIHRETFVVSKANLQVLTIVETGDAVKTQILVTKRPVVIYLGQMIVRGQLHVSAEASAMDLLDEARDFYAVTEANIFHLHSATPAYAREVPLLFVNRPLVQGYHLHTE
jgi:hypothetical protein